MDHFIERFRLDVQIFEDCTWQTWYLSDPGNNMLRKIVDQWKRCGRIGAGASGEVFEERSNRGDIRAVKVMRKSEDSDLSSYKKELVAMAQLSKDNDLFVELYGWYECDRFLYLAMEYLELCHITKCFKDCMAEIDVRAVAKQLLKGVAKMHEKGIIHRDLKPQNILVFQKDPIWIKIGDFGCSKVLQKNEPGAMSLTGTEDFAAPEVLGMDDTAKTNEYANAVDVWSVGCVLYYLLTHQVPFPSGKLSEYCKAKNPEFPDHHLRKKNVSPAGISLIQNFMTIEASKRVSASDALRDPWVTGEKGLPKAAEWSDIYSWQSDAQAYASQRAGRYIKQPRSITNQQTPSIRALKQILTNPTIPPEFYQVIPPMGPVAPSTEFTSSDRHTVPSPDFYHRRRQRTSPAEHNSTKDSESFIPSSSSRRLHKIAAAKHISTRRPSVRERGRDETAVAHNRGLHQSLQQEETTLTFDYPDHDIAWEGPSRASPEPAVKSNQRSRTGADANYYYDAELPRRPWFDYLNEDFLVRANNHHNADSPRHSWLSYLNEDVGVDANSPRNEDLTRHFTSGDDNNTTDWSMYHDISPYESFEPVELFLDQLHAEQAFT